MSPVPVCPVCKSWDIQPDAIATWCPVEQTWVLAGVLDNCTCQNPDCGWEGDNPEYIGIQDEKTENKLG